MGRLGGIQYMGRWYTKPHGHTYDTWASIFFFVETEVPHWPCGVLPPPMGSDDAREAEVGKIMKSNPVWCMMELLRGRNGDHRHARRFFPKFWSNGA